METAASKLLHAARSASLASRTAAADASRAAAMASRSSRAAAASRAAAKASRSSRATAAATARAARLGLGAIDDPVMSCPTRGGDASTMMPRDDAPSPSRSFDFDYSSDDYEHVPDDAKVPSDKDVESDEAVWAFYSRWCEAFNKELDHAEMVRRFKIFRYHAKDVHHWNTHVPLDPEDAAKKREAQLLISKGEDVSHFDQWHLPMELGPCADGGDPFISEHSKLLLEEIGETDPFSENEVSLGKTENLNEMN